MMAKLGCIADDFTGATDLGSMLVRGGLRTNQWLGVPMEPPTTANVDAIVISLKTRSLDASAAVEESLAALKSLERAGCDKFFFKYCSTFDSTDKGNIGPVAEALLDKLDLDQTIFCPAFPENGRTVCHGHLFVDGVLLSESGMQHHPVNPMRDPYLVRVLQRQAKNEVRLVDFSHVQTGSTAIRKELERLNASGIRLVIADALTDEHLISWSKAIFDLPLVTGGSAIAKHLAEILSKQQQSGQTDLELTPALPEASGKTAVLAGSCSPATNRQVTYFKQYHPAFSISAKKLIAEMDAVVAEALDFLSRHLNDGPVLVYSTATPGEIQRIRAEVGDQVAQLVESAFGKIAKGLIALGVMKLIVAGGETSGAVLQSLGIRQLSIGPEIAPGVPWTKSLDEPKMALALKSGNFGQDDFFARALGMLQ